MSLFSWWSKFFGRTRDKIARQRVKLAFEKLEELERSHPESAWQIFASDSLLSCMTEEEREDYKQRIRAVRDIANLRRVARRMDAKCKAPGYFATEKDLAQELDRELDRTQKYNF